MAKVNTDNEIEISVKETLENSLSYEKRWEAAIPKIIMAFPKFTNEDLKHLEGSEHKRWKLMMKKTGLSHEGLINFLNTVE